jgi:outer membrane protein OmpA-like peptidoglycan-associated protein
MSRTARLGFFLVATLLVLFVGVFLIGNEQFLFRRTYRVMAEFQNVAGLNNGANVRVGGIHLGTVRYIALPSSPNGKLTAVIDLDASTKNRIRKDSVATIKTEGLLGDKYVDISFGSEKAPAIENGDTIKGETTTDLSDAALSATNRARDAAAAFQDDAEAMKQSFLLRGYFKKRGYQNANELTKNRISRLPPQPSSKEFAYDAQKIFSKPDNAKLAKGKVLNQAGQYLEQNKFKLAVVAASSDTGDTERDRMLTQARAKVVRDYLVQNFRLDDTRMKIVGLGKTNRSGEIGRVEILVYR